jgi:hypothetical protein
VEQAPRSAPGRAAPDLLGRQRAHAGGEVTLDGEWRLERLDGILPPLGRFRKRIRGRWGSTRLGPIVVPFRVVRRRGRIDLTYVPGLLVDELRPSPGGWEGVTRLGPLGLGRFRMTPGERGPAPAGSRGPARS